MVVEWPRLRRESRVTTASYLHQEKTERSSREKREREKIENGRGRNVVSLFHEREKQKPTLKHCALQESATRKQKRGVLLGMDVHGLF
jgi:hypothetical protein